MQISRSLVETLAQQETLALEFSEVCTILKVCRHVFKSTKYIRYFTMKSLKVFFSINPSILRKYLNYASIT